MELGEFEALLAEISKEWNQAELDIKLAEQVCEDVILPAVNELRYAGRRLVDALTAIAQGKDKGEIEVLLHDARLDCHRARHDAIDAAVSQIGDTLGNMEKRLGFDAILRAYPAFAAFNSKYLQSQALIAATREAREKRNEIYAEIEAANFPELVREYQDIRSAEDIMKSLAARGRAAFLVALGVIGVGVVLFLFWVWAQIAPSVE